MRRRKEETRTWMSRWSDRQPFVGIGSDWFSVGTGERNFPPNIRVIGDSTKLAYPCPWILYQLPSSAQRDQIIDAPRSLDLPPQFGQTETPRVLLPQVQNWQTGDH
jgi:hypothetical protein